MKKNFSVVWSAAVISLVAASVATAEVSTITIQASVSNAPFRVDGMLYKQPVTFNWEVGSVHIVDIPFDYGAPVFGVTEGTRFNFKSWTFNGDTQLTGSSITVVTPSVPRIYTANYDVEYRVRLQFGVFPAKTNGTGRCGDNPQTASMSGAVYLAGTCYWNDVDVWTARDTILTLQPVTYPYFLFTGWGINGNAPNSKIDSVVVTAPIYLYASFLPAKHIQFNTQPAGFPVAVDGTAIQTSQSGGCEPLPLPLQVTPTSVTPACAGSIDLLPGTTHTISVVSPLLDRAGNYWVLDSWSNGAPAVFEYTVPADSVPEVLTARLVRGIPVVVATNPRNLAVTIDGTNDSTMKPMVWGVGSSHTIAAPAEQIVNGRKYAFKGWSNGGAAEQVITPTDDLSRGGLTLVASYEAMPRAVIESSAAGVKFHVEGGECAAPCILDRPAGTKVVVTAPATSTGDVSRHDFVEWRDATGATGSPEFEVTFDRETQLVYASYRTFNRLTVVSDPSNGVEVAAEPASPDGFYPTDAHVMVSVHPRGGFKFRRWEGDAQGVSDTAWVHMNSPRYLRAVLDRAPYVDDAGVRNAADVDALPPLVAAGSLIAIVGESLAPEYKAGPASPLAQTLSGVAVQVDDRILLLVVVSLQRIDVLLLSDMSEGRYMLVVHVKNYPDVEAEFTVVRNAPGLFSNLVDTTAYAVALHENGKPVTVENPAKRGEEITLLGTGFGPFDKPPVDGFALPDRPVITLVDKAELACGDLLVSATWSGAAAGRVGTTATKVRVPAEFVSGNNEIWVSVNGIASNTVVLPVE